METAEELIALARAGDSAALRQLRARGYSARDINEALTEKEEKEMALTLKQAEYQAKRAEKAAYREAMNDPHGPGRNADRQDSADMSGRMAYNAKMRKYGFPDHQLPKWWLRD